jgi:two-component system sensor histidine kinase DegS
LVNVPALSGDKDLPQKLHVLKLAATSIGCLLENGRLRQEVQEKEAYVMRLVSSTIEVQESERERICLEVHDGVGQTLVAAFQHLQALQSILPPQESQTRQMVSRTVALVRQAIQEAREVINSLTPATLSGLGLVSTLRQELKEFENDTGCKVEFEAAWPRLPQETEIALYRIVHEAVTNVRKHANSQKMRIELSRLPDRLVALIKDWGVGFDLSQQEAIPTRHSAGLFSLRKRAELLGGACEVRSTPGQGTEIKVEVPLPRTEENRRENNG